MRQRKPERIRAWRQLIAPWKQSGPTINAFWRERKLTRSNFDRWRRILAAATAGWGLPDCGRTASIVSAVAEWDCERRHRDSRPEFGFAVGRRREVAPSAGTAHGAFVLVGAGKEVRAPAGVDRLVSGVDMCRAEDADHGYAPKGWQSRPVQ